MLCDEFTTTSVTKAECQAAIARDWLEVETPVDDQRDIIGWLELPTGCMPYYGEQPDCDGIDVPVCCWYLHAYVYMARHDPENFHAIGTSVF